MSWHRDSFLRTSAVLVAAYVHFADFINHRMTLGARQAQCPLLSAASISRSPACRRCSLRLPMLSINRLNGPRISYWFVTRPFGALVDFGLQRTARPERRMARREWKRPNFGAGRKPRSPQEPARTRANTRQYAKKDQPDKGLVFLSGGPAGAWTLDQRIMLTTTAFAASFEFVVWTIPSRYRLAV